MRRGARALICTIAGAVAFGFSADAAPPVKPATSDLLRTIQGAPRAPPEKAAPTASQKPPAPATKKAATPQAKPAPQTAAKPQTPAKGFVRPGRPGRTATGQ